MLDAHCHMDLYQDPSRTAFDAECEGVFVVCVTNLPSAFLAARPHIRQFNKVRLALGLHPLNAQLHSDEELSRFGELVDQTSFIGEVGLDFSREGYQTRDRQVNSFQFALRCLNRQPKFVTIHSRRAETTVLELLQQEYAHPVVFHWYSGTLTTLESVIGDGHYFSINPSMTSSKKGKAIIEQIPRDRILTESDGPFIEIEGRQIVPKDIQIAEHVLAEMWGTDSSVVRKTVMRNFQRLMEPLRQSKRIEAGGRPDTRSWFRQT
jgi:TatD DNase family protein